MPTLNTENEYNKLPVFYCKHCLSLNIRNTHKAPDGWTFVCLDYSAEEIRLGAINTGVSFSLLSASS